MSHRKYLAILLAFTAAFIVIGAIGNIFIDPYGIFDARRVAGVNALKPFAGTRVRVSKPYQLVRAAPRTLIAGNSRPELGLDPAGGCWGPNDSPIFNAGLPGIGVFQQARMIQSAIHAGSVQTVLWGLDFLDFLATKHNERPGWPLEPKTPNHRLPIEASGVLNPQLPIQRLTDMRDAALSISALFDAVATVTLQSDLNNTTRTLAGFNPARDYLKIIATEGQAVLFEQKNREIIGRLNRRQLSLFSTGQQTSDDFESVRFILKMASESSVNVILFINPYHAEYLTAIDLTGHWQKLEQWKRTLTQLVVGSENARLFDFNAFDQYSTERPPVAGVIGKALKWYWEPAHYRREFGELMISQMLDRDCYAQFGNVGTELTDSTLATHLHELSASKNQYKADYSDRVEILNGYRSN